METLQVRIKGILFDKDGTIFDFQKSWGYWFYDLSKKLTNGNNKDLLNIFKKFSFDKKEKRFNNDSVFASSTFEENIQGFKSILVNLKKEEIKKIAIDSTQTMKQIPVTNLIDLFTKLKSKNYLLGIVTNDLENTTIMQLRKANICEYFDYIVGSDSGYGAKPNTGQLTNFCERFDISPFDTYMVGDTIHDMIAGKKAKMHTIGVLTGIANENQLKSNADIVINNISEISKTLDLLN